MNGGLHTSSLPLSLSTLLAPPFPHAWKHEAHNRGDGYQVNECGDCIDAGDGLSGETRSEIMEGGWEHR